MLYVFVKEGNENYMNENYIEFVIILAAEITQVLDSMAWVHCAYVKDFCICYKIGWHQMTPLAIILNLVTRWCCLHWFNLSTRWHNLHNLSEIALLPQICIGRLHGITILA